MEAFWASPRIRWVYERARAVGGVYGDPRAGTRSVHEGTAGET
jgi:hypothetical protein